MPSRTLHATARERKRLRQRVTQRSTSQDGKRYRESQPIPSAQIKPGIAQQHDVGAGDGAGMAGRSRALDLDVVAPLWSAGRMRQPSGMGTNCHTRYRVALRRPPHVGALEVCS